MTAPPRLTELPPVVALALAEDIDAAGDVTSLATVDADRRVSGAVVSRVPGVAAGTQVAASVFAAVDPEVEVTVVASDGAVLLVGDVLLTVEGPARAVLTAERTALNLLTHLCGVATLTARYVAEVEGTGAVVRDTRKTLPGLRLLEKAAVLAGGGVNHRFTLSDGLLVKDNHVVAAGGVGPATRRALAAAGDLPVQVEVDSLEQLEEALVAGARAVLLDNFSLNDLPAAVARCHAGDAEVFVEASGGVTLETIWAIASTGVDAIAVGALTHSAPALDLALDL